MGIKTFTMLIQKSVIDLAIKSKHMQIHYIMSFLHIACKK